MEWRELIIDFNGLITELVQRLSRHKVADALSHDKKTIIGWLAGTLPSNSMDVAWVIRLALQNGIDLSRFQAYNPIYDLSPLLSYEENVQKEPMDLSWLTNTQPPPVVKTDFCGLELDGPLGVASSPLIGNDRWAALMLGLGFGLSTFKTKRNESKQSWFPPHIAFVLEPPDLTKYDSDNPVLVPVTLDRRELKESVPNIVNSIGVPSESPVVWQETYERIARVPRGHLVGISVIGEGASRRDVVQDFGLAVEKAKDLNPPFIELNLSCPNLGKDGEFYSEPSVTEQICAKARRILDGTGIALVVKLRNAPTQVLQDLLKNAGKYIDAVAYRNTIQVRPVKRDRDGALHSPFVGREFGGLSGPCTFEVTRKGVHELVKVRQHLGQQFRIIAMGGVATPGHVVELLDAGADVIQACTAPMFDPLLAWKTRFHLKQFEREIATDRALPLLQPRDQVETESLRNAFEAYGEIQRRQPGRAVPYDVFQKKWNAWIEQRPSAPVGRAHRVSAPRTFAEWIRDFMR